jgi:hypothetical protein
MQSFDLELTRDRLVDDEGREVQSHLANVGRARTNLDPAKFNNISGYLKDFISLWFI